MVRLCECLPGINDTHLRLGMSTALCKIISKNPAQIIASTELEHICKQMRIKWVNLFGQKGVSFS